MEEKKIEEMTNEEVTQELEKYAEMEQNPGDDGSGKGLLLLAAGGVAALVAAGVFVAGKLKKHKKKKSEPEYEDPEKMKECSGKEKPSKVIDGEFKEVEVTEQK